MRILVFTNLYPNPYQPHRGSFNRRELRALAKHHHIRVVSPIAWTDEIRDHAAQGRRLSANRRWECDGIIADYPRYYFPPKVLRGTYGHCMLRSVERTVTNVISELKPDLIYAPWVYPDGWAAVRLGRRFGLPVIVKAHGSDVLQLHVAPARIPPTISAMQSADHVIAVSQDLANKIVGLGVSTERVTRIYNGIDRQLFSPSDRSAARQRLGLQEVRTVLFVGNLIQLKGVFDLLDACAVLTARETPVRCYLIGEGPLLKTLNNRIREKKLGEWITIVGSVTNDQLPDWYRSADLFVLPSYSEGLPSVLVEATACGIPFVASRVGGIPEIAAHAASLLTSPGDPQQLADAILEMLEKSPHAMNIDGSIIRSLDDAAGEVTKVFESVLNGHAKFSRSAAAS